MNLEAAVITAVCTNKDIGSVLTENADDLFTSHRDVWEGVKSYYMKYKAVPDVEVIVDKFPDFEPVSGNGQSAYYVDKLRNEYIGNRLREIILQGGTSLKTNSSLRVLQQLQADTAALSKFTNIVKDLDLMDVENAETHYLATKARSDVMGGSPGIATGIKAIDTAYSTGMAPGHLIYIIGWPSRGKRISVDSKVVTPSGLCRYGDLQIGDKVVGRNGAATTVTGISNRGVGKAYRVRFNDGASVIADPDHLWSIYAGRRGQGRDNLITLTTQEILDRGLFRDRADHKEYKAIMPLVGPVQYDKVDLPIDPYVLGQLLGDGTLGREQVILSTNDKETIIEIARRLPGHRVSHHKNSSQSCERYGILGMTKKIKALGLKVHGKDKFIPKIYLTAHHEARLDMLRGLMDSDGHAPKNQRAQFCSETRALAEGVQQLVWSLGGVARIRETSHPAYTVSIWLPENPFLLSRKAENYSPRPWFRAIESIDPCDDTEMMCISVDADDSLYVIQDYIVTHNSWLTTLLAVNAWKQGFRPMIVSLEMSPEVVRDRVYTVMGEGAFSNTRLTRGDINIDDFRSKTKRMFADRNSFIVVSSEGVNDVTPNVVQGKIDQHKPSIVFLDYHQLFTDNRKSNSPVERNMNISREFKLLAVNNNIPVVDITAATSNDVSDRNDPPMLAQVAWSKSLEYDADMAMAAHKEGDIIEVVSRKNRYGPEFGLFMNWDVDSGVIRESFDR